MKQIKEKVLKEKLEEIKMWNVAGLSLTRPINVEDVKWATEQSFEKAIDHTLAEVFRVIEGLPRWDEVELKKGVGMKRNKRGYFIKYYDLLAKIKGEEK